ncbi:hypothetical protein RB195_011608 [Necator americanus]|uniref:VWFA domain-containing protein n=1 Tax=Necator americanus TaxID=51031 RepID=A0ABR1D3D9_NECAM
MAASDATVLGTFEALCAYPFFYGTGKLQGMECEVSYLMDTFESTKAYDLCATLSPFEVKSYKFGYPTTCLYVKTHNCEDNELALYGKCLVVKSYSEFSPDECGGSYKVHSIEHREELKWVTVLLELTVADVWISNKGGSAKWLNPRFGEGTNERNVGDMNIALRIKGDSFGSYLRGTAFYEKPSKKLPHLCSRAAMAFETTIRDTFNIISNLGIQSEMGRDRSGAMRPFSFVPLMIPIRGTKFDPHLRELHEACQLLPNGYAASLYDYYTKEEFKKVRAKFPSGMYRTTVGRMSSYDTHEVDCMMSNKDYKAHRKRWTYYGPGNFTALSNEEFWENDNPAEKCSDLPRTTAGLLQGYLDIPAIARRPVICTYGNPPNVPPLNPNDQCNKAAHFNHVKQRCVCNNPDADGKRKDPKKYANFPEGIICIDCTNTTITRSIMFVLDQSGTVKEDGWEEQKKFMFKATEMMKNIKVGIVIIAGKPYIQIPLDKYENNKEKIKHFLENEPWKDLWTGIGWSLKLARESLEKDSADEKIIVMVSDGDQDICAHDYPTEKCPQEVKNKVAEYNQKSEAKKVHAVGIRVIYVLVGNLIETQAGARDRVLAIAGGQQNIVPVSSFTSFDASVLDTLIKTICTPVL